MIFGHTKALQTETACLTLTLLQTGTESKAQTRRVTFRSPACRRESQICASAVSVGQGGKTENDSSMPSCSCRVAWKSGFWVLTLQIYFIEILQTWPSLIEIHDFPKEILFQCILGRSYVESLKTDLEKLIFGAFTASVFLCIIHIGSISSIPGGT